MDLASPANATIPVCVISGFLGAGKTTLLNALLRRPALSDTVVVVNEFGDVGIDAALIEARKAAKPGQVEVRTGGFSIYPRYAPNSRTGAISGWQGSAELVIEGRDTATLSQLAGKLNTMTVARTGFTLSREAREKVEGEVSATAIARFRAQADAYAKQFGFAGYTVREVNVNTGGDGPTQPVPMYRAQAMQATVEAPLPVEAGRANVTATVSGSVQMSIR